MAVATLPAFDPRSVESLRRAAQTGDPHQAIRGAAQQFEALMLHQMLKAMRATVPENPLTDSSAQKLWQELADQQLASDLAKSGGFGLAATLTRQWLPKSAPIATPATLAANLPTPKEMREAASLVETSATGSAVAQPEVLLPPVSERSFVQGGDGGEPVGTEAESAAPVTERSFVAERHWVQTLLGLDPTLTPLHTSEALPPLVPLGQPRGAERTDAATTAEGGEAAGEKGAGASLSSTSEVTSFQPLPADAKGADRVAHFVRQLLPAAQRAAQALGVAPEYLLAHAALETGWGSAMLKHPDGRPSNNLFNIKAGSDWDGERVRVRTTEYVAGRPQTQIAEFRAYPSIEAAFADYVRLLSENDRYARVRNARTPEAFAHALATAGYATDPAYAKKLTRLIRHEALHSALAEVGMKLA
ncbi:flagellar assembly peptidoglycan hydrolase FlgJ [Hydrogenophilus thiooxidans]|uniref:flagellar assembly peptidoglycan hydrolase FlgJ n=1 Tax=Hydrogenophilus thiooxidans TaxID=2820326 RepID=UPI001C231F39|nr:flagellar assembly peptidoglycan hydrolase FlgJ [Hydrogenophilus thiooxidans]